MSYVSVPRASTILTREVPVSTVEVMFDTWTMATTTPMANTACTARNPAKSCVRSDEVIRRMGGGGRGSVGLRRGERARAGSHDVIGAGAGHLEGRGRAECGDGARLFAARPAGTGPGDRGSDDHRCGGRRRHAHRRRSRG